MSKKKKAKKRLKEKSYNPFKILLDSFEFWYIGQDYNDVGDTSYHVIEVCLKDDPKEHHMFMKVRDDGIWELNKVFTVHDEKRDI